MTQVSRQRIAKNTGFLYVRMLFLLFISLYTSRIVLEKLGVTDFGVYNVVGGLATMCSFFSTSLSNATERYLNIALGQKDYKKANEIFNQNLGIFILIALGTIILSETIIRWCIFDNLIIPADKWTAAQWVYQFTIGSLAVNLIGIVFVASIIANENMKIFSFVGIFDGVAKLVIAFLIGSFPIENLITYSSLLFIETCIVQLFYAFFCFKNFEECRLKIYWNKNLIREMFGFIGWNVLGTGIYMAKDAGVNVLMNIFYGPIVNAARAISLQVSTGVSSFTNNIFVAIRPQMVKAYSANELEELKRLFFESSKFPILLYWIICLPVMLTIVSLLNIWLLEVPPDATIFTLWVLADSMLAVLTNPTWTIALSTGKLKKYTLYGNGMLMLIFPLCWVAFSNGFPPVSAFIVIFFSRFLQVLATVFIISKQILFSMSEYFRKVIIPVLLVIVTSLLIMYPIKIWCYNVFTNSLILVGVISVTSLIINILIINFSILTISQRKMLNG